jgi:hypothetical protein
MKHSLLAPLVAGAIAVAALPAHAQQIPNGGFETGLTGWLATGDVSTQGSAPHGLQQLWLTTAHASEADDFPLSGGALNRSGTSAAAVGTATGLETALGLAIGALDPDSANGIQAYEGSVVTRFVTANAGDVLSFSWNFGTTDTLNDYAFLVIDGQVTTLAQFDQATQATTFLGNSFETGVANYSIAFLSSGTHRIGFGVVDVGDFSATSTLAIDNVQITSVPEPGTLALMLAGSATLWARRRRGTAA